MKRRIPVNTMTALCGLPFLLGCAYDQTGFSVVAWGSNNDGQCDVPEPNSGFISIAAFGDNSAGVRNDGSIVVWGERSWEFALDAPVPNTGFIDVAIGYDHVLGLRADGSIAAWGYNDNGQCDVPDPNDNFIDIAAGKGFSAGLKEDGCLVLWPDDNPFLRMRRYYDFPYPGGDYVAISVSSNHLLCLTSEGSVIDINSLCPTIDPAPYLDAGDGFMSIAAGAFHSLGLREDGSVVAWGLNADEQCNLPQFDERVIAISAGSLHSLCLMEDGSIVTWGRSRYFRDSAIPEPNSEYVAVAAGGSHNLALKRIY